MEETNPETKEEQRMSMEYGGLWFDLEHVRSWNPSEEEGGGVYVVVGLDKERKQWDLLYVGETDDLSKLRFDKKHPKYKRWVIHTWEDPDVDPPVMIQGEPDIVLEDLYYGLIYVDDVKLRNYMKRRMVEIEDPPCN